MEQNSELLTVKEAAMRMRCGVTSIRRLISARRVDVVRISAQGSGANGRGSGGRILLTKESIDRVIVESTTPAISA